MNNTDNKEIITPEIKCNQTLVQGVAMNDYTGTISVNGKKKPFYVAWSSMLKRCYSKAKKPCYEGCTVSEEWLSLSKFKEWHDKHYIVGFQLDKDLINPNNKIYSAPNCIYIPQELNKLFITPNTNRNLPRGVTHQGKRFRARLTARGKKVNLGVFDTPEIASDVYKDARLMYVFDELQYYRKKDDISIRTMSTIVSNVVNGIL